MTERGSASVLGTAIAGLILVLGMMVVTAAGVVSAAFHARTAAEAAALAAVSPVVRDPEGAARGVAALNRATLVACRCPSPGSQPPLISWVRVQTVVRVPFFGELTLPAESSAEYRPNAW
jgi:hypothetical protein